MAKLIHAMPTSLDGYIEDETGKFDWAMPDDEGFAFINDLERPIGTYLYGRKMYQTLAIWETPDDIPGLAPAMLEFAQIWQAADKIVYSRSLETVSNAQDASRAGIRPAGGSRLEGSIASRRFGGWSDPRRTRDPDRARRRDSSVRRAYCDWRRQAGSAQQCMRKAGSPGRALLC
jgi:hypothetical protein